MKSNSHHYDLIVAGVGSMGASASYYGAEQGLRVLGLEAHGLVNDKGSHSGHTRIIRKAYFEHPDYVPLLEAAYQNWQLLEEKWGRQLYFPTGLFYIAPPESELLKGVQYAASKYQIPLMHILPDTLREVAPMFKLPEKFDVWFEPEAGYLLVDEIIHAYATLASSQGATLNTGEEIKSWEMSGNRVRVHTSKSEYTTDRLILTAGSQLGNLVPAWKPLLQPTLQVMAWAKPNSPLEEAFREGSCWMIDDPEKGIFYGFPAINGGPDGFKLAHHFRGRDYFNTPQERTLITADSEPIQWVLEKYLPQAEAGITHLQSCLYTYSPDAHFLFDFVEEGEGRVVAAGGFSGHGFKFSSIVGQALVEAVLSNKIPELCRFLGISRLRKN
jgi:sarcosine oxidase